MLFPRKLRDREKVRNHPFIFESTSRKSEVKRAQKEKGQVNARSLITALRPFRTFRFALVSKKAMLTSSSYYQKFSIFSCLPVRFSRVARSLVRTSFCIFSSSFPLPRHPPDHPFPLFHPRVGNSQKAKLCVRGFSKICRGILDGWNFNRLFSRFSSAISPLARNFVAFLYRFSSRR